MNTSERRNEIIERMKIRRADTAHNLAFEFGVTERTIRSDVQELSVSGHPIYADAGRGGGIRWVGGKRQFPFSEREMAALHNAIASAPPEDKPVLENLLRSNEKPETETVKNDLFGILADGISQQALARKLGISKSYFSRLLSGERKPSAELAGRIEKYKKEAFDKDESD